MAANAGLPQVVIRFFHHDIRRKNPAGFTTTLVWLQVGVAVFVGSLVGLFHRQIGMVTGHSGPVVILIVILLASTAALNETLQAFHRAANEALTYSITYASRRIAGVILGILLLYWHGTAVAYLSGLLLGEVGWAIRMIQRFASRGWLEYFRAADSSALNLLLYGLPLGLNVLVSMLLSFGDRFVLKLIQGDAAVAQYVVAYTVGSLLGSALARPLNLFSYPRYTSTWELRGPVAVQRLLSRWSQIYIAVAVAVFIAGFGLGPLLIEVIAGRQYSNTVSIVPLVLAGSLLQGLGYLTVAGLHLAGRVKAIAAITLVALAFNLAGNFWLIPRFGVLGAGWMTLLTYLLQLVLSTTLGFRTLRFPILRLKVALPIGSAALLASAVLATWFERGGFLVEAAGAGVAVIIYVAVILLLFPDARHLLIRTIRDRDYRAAAVSVAQV